PRRPCERDSYTRPVARRRTRYQGGPVEPWGYRLSRHILLDHAERHLPEAWIRRTLRYPDRKRRLQSDLPETEPYMKATRDFGGRYLHVVVNHRRRLVMSAFFDSRLGRRQYGRRSR